VSTNATTTAPDAPVPRADVIDLLAGAGEQDRVRHLRDLRPQAREQAQRSFEVLLEPAEPGAFPVADRYAVAAFVALVSGSGAGADFYLDLLREESEQAADWVLAAAAEASRVASEGPYGSYREPGLAAESVPGPTWVPSASVRAALGPRVAAALAHAHLLVLHPRESRAERLGLLLEAGWDEDGIVTLSQLIAFLTFQLREAWGLAVLAGITPATVDPAASSATGSPAPAGPAPTDPSGSPTASDVPAPSDSPADGPSRVLQYPDLDRPDRFTQDGLGWVPWIEPVAREELSPVQDAALLDDFRRSSPYFRLLVRDPEALQARTLTDQDIFFNTDGGAGRAERELSAAATSRRNGCVYCASVHSAAATHESGREEDVQRLLDEGTSADLGDRTWNAVVAATDALADTPLTLDADPLEGLREAGLTDPEIVDVLSGASFFHWANRLMLSLGEPEIPARRKARS
jgi:alkylhydroperoxidase domain protein/CMD domain protein